MTEQTKEFLNELEKLMNLTPDLRVKFDSHLPLQGLRERIGKAFEKAVEAEVNKRFADDGK